MKFDDLFVLLLFWINRIAVELEYHEEALYLRNITTNPENPKNPRCDFNITR